MTIRELMVGAAVAAALLAPGAGAVAADSFSVADVISYPYVLELVSAPHADRIAWVRDVKGVRNVWVAEGPNFTPRQATQFTEDDGQEITQLTFSPDGATLVFVRGGDHDANSQTPPPAPTRSRSPCGPPIRRARDPRRKLSRATRR